MLTCKQKRGVVKHMVNRANKKVRDAMGGPGNGVGPKKEIPAGAQAAQLDHGPKSPIVAGIEPIKPNKMMGNNNASEMGMQNKQVPMKPKVGIAMGLAQSNTPARGVGNSIASMASGKPVNPMVGLAPRGFQKQLLQPEAQQREQSGIAEGLPTVQMPMQNTTASTILSQVKRNLKSKKRGMGKPSLEKTRNYALGLGG